MTQEVIAEVRSRANIVDVVGEHVMLKKSSKGYMGLCPFHVEKTPSFSVTPDKGIFKCFGCGEGGDVFSFVQKQKKLDFIDAVKELAHRYGVQLVQSVEQKQEYDKRSYMQYLYEQACQYYRRLLSDATDGGIGRDYLEKRGIPDEIIEKFKLGYAPQAGGLLRYLTETTKAAPATLEEAGLVGKYQDSNSYFDLFRNRLMIPISDEQGRVIAFGGRTLGDDKRKYLNSKETPIYTKGRHLYAYNLAKDAIKEKDAVIVVEGYFDAITPHQFGFTNTVATLGTALTEVQAKLMVRQTESKRVYLSFDADAAGVKAVEKGADTLTKLAEGIGLQLRVIQIPGSKDPDECLRSHEGPQLFAQAIDEAPLLIDYQLQQAIAECNVATHTGKIDAANKLVPILAQIAKTVERGEYVREWAMKIGVREEELVTDVGRHARQSLAKSNPQQGGAARNPIRFHPTARGATKNGSFEAEQQLLALYLTSRDDYERVSATFADWDLFTSVHQMIKESIEGIGTQFNNVEDLRCRLLDRLGPEKDASAALVEIILRVDELKKQNSPLEILITQFKGRLLKERLDRALSAMRSLLGSSQNESDQSRLQSKIKQLSMMGQSLVSAGTAAELDELKRRIEELEAEPATDRCGDNA